MTGPALIGGALALAATVAIMGRDVWHLRGRRDAASVARRLVDGGILIGALSLLLWGALRRDVVPERTGAGTVTAGVPSSLAAVMGGTGPVLVLSIGGGLCAVLLLAGQLAARRIPAATEDAPAPIRPEETPQTRRAPRAG